MAYIDGPMQTVKHEKVECCVTRGTDSPSSVVLQTYRLMCSVMQADFQVVGADMGAFWW